MTSVKQQAMAASSSSILNPDMSSVASSSTDNRPSFDPTEVKTTNALEAYRDEGKAMLNNYTRHAKIGGGQHGEVYLCYQMNPQYPPKHPKRRVCVAIKGVKRDDPHDRKLKQLRQQRHQLPITSTAHTPLADKLGTAEAKILKEIAIMKKCRHPHVVRLLEVIDDRMHTKVYMVMEFLDGGEVRWQNKQNNPILSIAQTRRIMRDAILGLEYLHHQGIIHRDIKPANLLWTRDRKSVKIADFGVSHFSYAQRLAALGRRHANGAAKIRGENGEENDNDEAVEPILLDESDLSRRAGTPMFLAPEIVNNFLNPELDDAAASTSNVSESAGKTPTLNGNSNHRHYGAHASTTSINTNGPQPPSRRPSSPPRPIDKAIDIWALGVTFYCLLFGRVPFRPDSDNQSEWGLYHAIGTKDWAVRDTMGADRIWCGSNPRRRNKEEERQQRTQRVDDCTMEAEAERWRLPECDPDDLEEEEDSGTESEKEKSRLTSTGEGDVIITLLEKFLQKDPRNRITLAAAKRDSWFLVEIAEPKEWIELTAPRRKITVSASDASEAMQPVHFRWKWNKVGRRISSLFKSSKPPPTDAREFLLGTSTVRGYSRSRREEYDDARGPVKSDPAVKIRRYKSSTTASIARIKTNTSPSSPDPGTSFSWDSPSPVRAAAQASLKGKERVVDPAERAAAGKRLQSKSIDRWPGGPSSMQTGSRLTVATRQGPDSSSKSTSAIDDQGIAAQRRGSLPFLYAYRNRDQKTSAANTGASSSIASSPTDATGAWYSNQISRASSKSNFQQSAAGPPRSRTRFAQLVGAISSWRPSRFSSSSTSPTESEKNIKRGIGVTPTAYNRARMSEEALAMHRSPAYSPRDVDPSASGVLTPDRRASSWGQGDTPDNHNMLGIPIVRSLDSALHPEGPGRIVSGMKGLSLANGYNGDIVDDEDEEEDEELGPACYDDDSSTIASGGDPDDDDLGDVIRSDSGGEILQPTWTEDHDIDMSEDGDSMIQEHVIHSAPYGEVVTGDEEEEASAASDSEDEMAPVTFSPRKRT